MELEAFLRKLGKLLSKPNAPTDRVVFARIANSELELVSAGQPVSGSTGTVIVYRHNDHRFWTSLEGTKVSIGIAGLPGGASGNPDWTEVSYDCSTYTAVGGFGGLLIGGLLGGLFGIFGLIVGAVVGAGVGAGTGYSACKAIHPTIIIVQVPH